MRSDTPMCPECGATVPAGKSECWLCGAPLDAAVAAKTSDPNPYASSDVSPNIRTFGISSLMLVMTLVAIWSGVLALNVPLALLSLLLIGPALLRTVQLARRAKRQGIQQTASGKVAQFISSCLLVAAIIAAMGFTAYFSCMAIAYTSEPLHNWQGGIVVVVIGGLLVAIGAAVAVGRLLVKQFWLPK